MSMDVMCLGWEKSDSVPRFAFSYPGLVLSHHPLMDVKVVVCPVPGPEIL